MSRTIRRKNAHQQGWWIGSKDDVSQREMRLWGASTPEQYIARRRARFHADRPQGHWSPPSWFRRQLNKKVARANAAMIHRGITMDCWDDHLPRKHQRNAAWLWW